MSGVEEFGKPFEHALVTAKLFQHGGSQAVRLPKAFRFEGAEVSVRREGEAVILEPIKKKRPPTKEEMDAFWAKVDSLGGADFPDREQPPAQERDFW
ncbi:MAG TPA: AbrB/MazE/SpoVT family DNA-binding domain-containing protein [Caulobacteraceae bacterium]|jgi:antitoxin VapB|nr:AbrB/MazE/SpoVT family DNA-binding domain-containing protein [Caulobacteraceae bacterium]